MNSIVLHRVASSCIELHQVASICIKLHRVASSCIKLHRFASSCIELHQVASSCIKFHRVASSCIKLHRFASSCIKLHQVASTDIGYERTVEDAGYERTVGDAGPYSMFSLGISMPRADAKKEKARAEALAFFVTCRNTARIRYYLLEIAACAPRDAELVLLPNSSSSRRSFREMEP